MPLLSKISTFSFNKDSCLSTSTFMLVKNLLLFINFLSLLAGFILIGAGGYLVSNTLYDLGGLRGGIAAGAISVGIVITLISFLGCFGAANEKGILLKTYFGLLIILIILEISVGIAAYATRDKLDGTIENAWKASLQSNDSSRLNTLTAIQTNLQCCGFKSNDTIYGNCTFIPTCRDKLVNSATGSLNNVGGAGIAIGVIEIVGLIFSVYLFKRIAAKDNAQSSLLNEAWRINRTKIQYGYQNYQYA